MADESVCVGVRVRPFNKREMDLNAVVCLRMQGPSTIIWDENQKELTYSFDESLWSHDGFVEHETGYLHAAPGSQYKDQRYVFEKFGQRVLNNAWDGYNSCCFAYGQTGAGKSYSMVGYGVNKGIVPLACDEIFRRMNVTMNNPKIKVEFEVVVSMIEIYNETVQDLMLEDPSQRPKKGLDIRENKMLGIYIPGLIKKPVDSYEAIEREIDFATSNRTVGSTLMNATSSRAHTVLMIEFKQTITDQGTTNVKQAMINLVDLAGSEKAGQTGASGDRLKEGCAINKSLSALGNVIEKLAVRSNLPPAKQKGVMIPYRDSKLTRLLQNALGGNSKTIMICALSPASSNYEETCSTLRYADRAKKIKNSVISNEDPQQRLIREMREENEQLREMLAQLQSASNEEEAQKQKMEMALKIDAKQQELDDAKAALAEMQMSFSEKLSREEERRRRAAPTAGRDARFRNNILGEHMKDVLPHLANLNADLQLTCRTRHYFLEDVTTIITNPHGRNAKAGDSDSSSGSDDESSSDDSMDDDINRIFIRAEHVYARHAEIINSAGKVTLSCFHRSARHTFLNGERVSDVVTRREKQAAQALAQKGDFEEDNLQRLSGEMEDGKSQMVTTTRFDGTERIERLVHVVLLRIQSSRDSGRYLYVTKFERSNGEVEAAKKFPGAKRAAKQSIEDAAMAVLTEQITDATRIIQLELDETVVVEERAKSESYKDMETIYVKEYINGYVDPDNLEPDDTSTLASIGLPEFSEFQISSAKGKRTFAWLPLENDMKYRMGKTLSTKPQKMGLTLHHGDRLAFGQKAFFVYVDPTVGAADFLVATGEVSYQRAKEEVHVGLWKDCGKQLRDLGAKGLGGLALIADADAKAEVEGQETEHNQVPFGKSDAGRKTSRRLIGEFARRTTFRVSVAMAAAALEAVLLEASEARAESFAESAEGGEESPDAKSKGGGSTASAAGAANKALQAVQQSYTMANSTLDVFRSLDDAEVMLVKAEAGIVDKKSGGDVLHLQDDFGNAAAEGTGKKDKRRGLSKWKCVNNGKETVEDEHQLQLQLEVAMSSAKSRVGQIERNVKDTLLEEAQAVQTAVRAEGEVIGLMAQEKYGDSPCDQARYEELMDAINAEKLQSKTLLPSARRRQEKAETLDKLRREIAVAEAVYKSKLKEADDAEQSESVEICKNAFTTMMQVRQKFFQAEQALVQEWQKDFETKLKVRMASTKVLSLWYGASSPQAKAAQAVVDTYTNAAGITRILERYTVARQSSETTYLSKQNHVKVMIFCKSNDLTSVMKEAEVAEAAYKQAKWLEWTALYQEHPQEDDAPAEEETESDQRALLLRTIESCDRAVAKRAAKCFTNSGDFKLVKEASNLLRVAGHGNQGAIIKVALRLAKRDPDPEFRKQAEESAAAVLTKLAIENMRGELCDRCFRDFPPQETTAEEEVGLFEEVEALKTQLDEQDQEIARLRAAIKAKQRLRADRAKIMHPKELSKEVVMKFVCALEAVESAEAAAVSLAIEASKSSRQASASFSRQLMKH
eukprot:TRINITY_DN14356_c0_g3_i1.p1 TRINITY_DN14356_c0_g3~~TRINITY_DN14356_c0_g3_i1.p1  ORF type:complete len:1531 (+),score=451.71 TRINITY_DN14356_c0_g3_i1:162-4754(+)